MARFARMLAGARRIADLQSELHFAAGELPIGELVVREVAEHLGLLAAASAAV